MRKAVHFFSAVIISALLLSCGGETSDSAVNARYIDPSSAENGNGTEGSPYNTFNGITFEPGTSYLLKRGTVLYEQITVTSSGTESEPVIIGAYGTGADPVIDGSEVVSSWSQAGSIYSNTLTPSGTHGRGNAVIDGNIQKFSTGTPAAGEYTISSGGVVQIFGDPSGKTVRLSRRYFGIHNNTGTPVSHIRIENIHIRQASLHGIHFEDSSHITVQNCRIEMCGGAYIGGLQAGNAVEFGNSSSYCTVNGCTISQIFDSGVTTQTYNNSKIGSNFIFTGNTIEQCGFAGVEIAVLSNGGMTGSSISDVLVKSNTITECGKGFSGVRYGNEGRGIKIKADNGAGSLSGVVVEQCIVETSAGEGIFISGDVGIVNVNRTLLSENTRGGLLFQHTLAVDAKLILSSSIIRENGDATYAGVAINTGEDIGGFELYHNTFYDNAGYGLSINADTASFDTSILSNNLFHSSSDKIHFVVIDDVGFDSTKNNFFREFGASVIIGYPGGSYSSVTAFNNYSGSDEISGNIGGNDPGLISVLNLDLSGTGSPCYHTGVSGTGVILDYSGKPFNTANPSIGAYEY